jgi:hypothetical protein
MHETIDMPATALIPSEETLFRLHGLPPARHSDSRMKASIRSAIELLVKTAVPRGIIKEISREEFEFIFAGEGLNEKNNPLEGIYKKGTAFALFAATMGNGVGAKISSLFKADEFVLGATLDMAASEATESAGGYLETVYRSRLKESGRFNAAQATLRFSPGYCGWDITGQKKLFAALTPEKIGVTLRESMLMQPLKSISGVIVAGDSNIFKFEDNFPFCAFCKTHTCRVRMETIEKSD